MDVRDRYMLYDDNLRGVMSHISYMSYIIYNITYSAIFVCPSSFSCPTAVFFLHNHPRTFSWSSWMRVVFTRVPIIYYYNGEILKSYHFKNIIIYTGGCGEYVLYWLYIIIYKIILSIPIWPNAKRVAVGFKNKSYCPVVIVVFSAMKNLERRLMWLVICMTPCNPIGGIYQLQQ